MPLVCAGRVARAHGVAVHRGIGERRQVFGRDRVLSQHTAYTRSQWSKLARERMEASENGLTRLLDAHHDHSLLPTLPTAHASTCLTRP